MSRLCIACLLGLLFGCTTQFTKSFDSGPVASFAAPEGFGIPEKAPYEEPEYFRTMEQGSLLELRRADGTELILFLFQVDTSLDRNLATFFPAPDLNRADSLDVNSVRWNYEIRDDGFTASTTSRGYRIRLFSQRGSPWTESEIEAVIRGVTWR